MAPTLPSRSRAMLAGMLGLAGLAAAFTPPSGNLRPLWFNSPGGFLFQTQAARQVATGSDFHVLLQADSTVRLWGESLAADSLFDSVPVLQVAAGDHHALFLTKDRKVVGRGLDDLGQATPPADLALVRALAAGAKHSVALTLDSHVVAWGDSSEGQLRIPSGLKRVVAVAAGGNLTAVLMVDSTVRVYGGGLDSASYTPPSGLTGVKAIAAGTTHLLALKGDGTVVAWGLDAYGQTDVPAGLKKVAKIAAGGYTSLALSSSGGLVHWGDSLTAEPDSLSEATYAGIAVNGYHVLAMKSDSSLRAWGEFDDLSRAGVVLDDVPGVVDVAPLGTGYATLGSDGRLALHAVLLPDWVVLPDSVVDIATNAFGALQCLRQDGTVATVLASTDTTSDAYRHFDSLLSAPDGLAGVVSIGNDSYNFWALKGDGTAAYWGYAPTGADVVASWSGLAAISSGETGPIGLRKDGTLLVAHDTLGLGTIPAAAADGNVVAVAAGAGFALALRGDGVVVPFGTTTSMPDDLGTVKAVAALISLGGAVESDGDVVLWGVRSDDVYRFPGLGAHALRVSQQLATGLQAWALVGDPVSGPSGIDAAAGAKRGFAAGPARVRDLSGRLLWSGRLESLAQARSLGLGGGVLLVERPGFAGAWTVLAGLGD